MNITNWKNGTAINPTDHPEIWDHFGCEFYHAFEHLPQTLLREIWKFDDEKQQIFLKTPIEDDIIIPWVKDEKILGYFACEMDTDTHFSQYRYFDFKRPNDLPRSVEVLSMFRTREKIDGYCHLKSEFIDAIVVPELARRGFKTALATCTDQMLPFYLRWGMNIIDQHDFHGFNRYLIQSNLG